MYYIIYGLLYAVSLLPFFILYAISDVIFIIVYHIAGYRKKVVLANLEIAFPEKTTKEKKAIAGKFYKNLIDTFIESIKLLSISQKQFNKRATMDLTAVNALIAKGRNIQMHSGHQMNWEYGHWAVASQMTLPWIGIYMTISNKAIGRIFYKIRNKGTTVLVSVKDFKSRAHIAFREQYALGLVADQNPITPSLAYWLNFFGRPAPFPTGPDKGARKNDTAVVFVRFVKLKRGYYRFDAEVVTEHGASLQEGELTLMYRDFLEETIRKNPDNYLWSHRRWKWEYRPEYKKRWIDKDLPPA
jgi:Kdo2-lipid IVA lauroyltransferase/acyltransferase